MRILVQKGDLIKEKSDLVVVNEFEDFEKLGGLSKIIDQATGGLIAKVIKEEGFTGKSSESILIRTEGMLPVKRVMVVGLGKKENFDLEAVREAAATAFTAAKKINLKKIVTALPGTDWGDLTTTKIAQAVAEGVYLAAYQYSRFKKMKLNEIKELIIIVERASEIRQVGKGIELGRIMATATVAARDLVNTPAQQMKPIDLVETAKQIVKNSNSRIKIKVLNRDQLTRLKSGAFLAIAQGSTAEPYLVHLKYTPTQAKAKKKICLVGKAITFDSGGLQVKPNNSMSEMGTMKVDMAGAAAVLGVFSVLAELKPRIAVEGIFAACENMPSGNAVRPGDVVTAMDGTTIEILHTDAEGRVTLADALAYALRQKPTTIIDLATLTSAVVVALGENISGAFSNNEKLLNQVLAAAKIAGEKIWELPLARDYKDKLDSKVADLNNTGGKEAGAIKAALFLEHFVKGCPWVHLDIAGPTFAEKPLNAYSQYGATGVGVRTMLELIRHA